MVLQVGADTGHVLQDRNAVPLTDYLAGAREYIDLVANAPLPDTRLAFDIGTGSGIIAAVLARRGVKRIVATDQDERALACASENARNLGLTVAFRLFPADCRAERENA